MMVNVQTFGKFLQIEMDKRRMSERAFARHVGVDSKTINKFLKFGEEEVGYPSMDFLIKLARRTNTDICYLMALIAPEVVIQSDLEASMLAERVRKLPKKKRGAIDDLILGMTLGGDDGNE